MRIFGRLLCASMATMCVQSASQPMGLAQAGITGRWHAQSNPPGTTWTAVLREDGPRVVGAISSCGPEISDGTVNGNTLTFKCTIGPRPTTFTGTISGDEIVFAWEITDPPDFFPIPETDRIFGPSAPRRFTASRVPEVADALANRADRARRAPAVTFDRILRADEEPTTGSRIQGPYVASVTASSPKSRPRMSSRWSLAWIWQSESYPGGFQATPLVIDGVLYTVEAPNNVVALDAATGRVLWKYFHRPLATARVAGHVANRGLAILGETLFMGTIDAHLVAINAYSGTLIWDVTVANPRDPACQLARCYGMTHAPLVVKDTVIVGVAGGDDDTPGFGIRGFIAAFEARTGKEVWRFYTIPAPGETGSETWSGDSWKTGGAGIWVTGSYDRDLNLTYWGTGNPAPPTKGAGRAGDNLYSDSVIALDADTGRLKWHYQFTPHDALDARTGQMLWQMPLTGSARSGPVSYAVDGKQYIAVATDNTLFTFALRR